MVLDTYELSRYDFGNQINFKLYTQTGFTPLDVTAFDASSYTGAVIKSYLRQGDRAFFFRDVERALTVQGQISQLINDIDITWDTQASGIGHFSYTSTDRPSVSSYLWLECELTKSGSKLSSQLVRVRVEASEGA